jgi:hypothetical protein
MSISSRSRCSMTKHSGALMSSRLMPPKPRRGSARVDEFVDVLGADFEVDAVDVGEALEQRDLALHHRLGGERAEIAQPEHGGAVGDDGDHVALGGVVVGQRRVARDVQAGFGDAGRIGQRQIARRGDRLADAGFQLARPAAGMHRHSKALSLLSSTSYQHVPIEDDIISDVLIRSSILRKIPTEVIVGFVLREIKPLMGAEEILHLHLDVELTIDSDER